MGVQTARPRILDQGISAVQAGDLETGKRLLARVLRDNPQNEEAWLWLSTAVDDLDRRTECLRRLLAINPRHRAAWKRLAALTSANPAYDRPAIENFRAMEFHCPKCGADLRYDVAEKGLLCAHCGHSEPVPQSSLLQSHRRVGYGKPTCSHCGWAMFIRRKGMTMMRLTEIGPTTRSR
jgi:hypothetical protein